MKTKDFLCRHTLPTCLRGRRSGLRAALPAAIAAAVALTACNFGNKEHTQGRGLRIVELQRDSMLHGLCIGHSADTLLFLNDIGDTLALTMSPTATVVGDINAGDQMAVMMMPTSTTDVVTLALNTTMLIGEWVENDPIAEGNVMGYRIGQGGAAEGINLSDLTIEGWSVYNGRLLLAGSYGIEQFTDTFAITRLTPDSLGLANRTTTHIMHRLQPGEANYENDTYDFDADPTAGMDFNPESQDVDVSPDILGEGPIY